MAGCPVFAKIVPFLAKFGPIFEFLSRFWPVLSRFWIRQTPDFTLPHTKSKLQMLYSYNYLIFDFFPNYNKIYQILWKRPVLSRFLSRFWNQNWDTLAHTRNPIISWPQTPFVIGRVSRFWVGTSPYFGTPSFFQHS